jgi:pullulanase/glycogen debranching enzyme
MLPGDTLFLMFNAYHEAISFVLPKQGRQERWERILDAAEKKWRRPALLRDPAYKLRSRSLAIFRLKQSRMR